MKERTITGTEPEQFDWASFLGAGRSELDPAWMPQELADRREDLAELGWLLAGIRKELELYRNAFPDGRFERELEEAFSRQVERLEKRTADYESKPELCDLNAYLGLKYTIRTLYKQLGAIVAGSDWQTPAKKLADDADSRFEESGFAQEEEGTYMRSYGSEAVKEHEEAALEAYYSLPGSIDAASFGFAATSGMKALELALIAYKSFTSEALPFYYQEGFYCEGADLAHMLLTDPVELAPDEMYDKVETNQPIGCLLVDPGSCWPVRPAADLRRLFDGLSRHRQSEPLYVIVDRTLTSITNPLFAAYADKLPEHIVLISVESGIKYMQYGFDLANVGYAVAAGKALESGQQRDKWVKLLGLLDAGADPVAIRQLPAPNLQRLSSRLSRLNRNARWMAAFLELLVREGKIAAYYPSVEPSEQYRLDGCRWLGSVFYICFRGPYSERDYENWIDAFVRSAPSEEHFVSGGSFGFDTFRMNAVSDRTGRETALRVSVGRDPIGQLLLKLGYLYSQLS